MNPAKILVIKLRSLGDTVLMTAPLIEVARAYPHAQIQVLVTDTWAPVLTDLPGVTKVWPFKRPKERSARARAMARMAYQLRKEKFDCVINLHASPSSSTLAWSTGAKTRAIHFHGHKDRNRYSTVVVPGKGMLKPAIERDMDALRALGLHIPAGRSPKIFLQQNDQREAKAYLAQLPTSGPLLGLSLGASRPTKAWPLERFAELAVAWCVKTKGSALAIAGPENEALIQSFLELTDQSLGATLSDLESRTQVRKRIHSTYKLSLRGLAGVIQQIDVLVGNDSGPKHIAVAVDTPTVTLFGPENPFEWHPYPPDRHPYLFIDPLPCRKEGMPGMPKWCALSVCTVEEHKCMKLIGIQSVLSLCEKVYKKAR